MEILTVNKILEKYEDKIESLKSDMNITILEQHLMTYFLTRGWKKDGSWSFTITTISVYKLKRLNILFSCPDFYQESSFSSSTWDKVYKQVLEDFTI